MPTSERLIRQAALAALVVVVAGIFIGGEQPGAGTLVPEPWDKVLHMAAYGTIAVLTGIAFPAASLPAVLLVTVTIGAADEIHQYFLPGRQAGIDDWFADLVGGLLVLHFIPLFRRHLFTVESG